MHGMARLHHRGYPCAFEAVLKWCTDIHDDATVGVLRLYVGEFRCDLFDIFLRFLPLYVNFYVVFCACAWGYIYIYILICWVEETGVYGGRCHGNVFVEEDKVGRYVSQRRKWWYNLRGQRYMRVQVIFYFFIVEGRRSIAAQKPR